MRKSFFLMFSLLFIGLVIVFAGCSSGGSNKGCSVKLVNKSGVDGNYYLKRPDTDKIIRTGSFYPGTYFLSLVAGKYLFHIESNPVPGKYLIEEVFDIQDDCVLTVRMNEDNTQFIYTME